MAGRSPLLFILALLAITTPAFAFRANNKRRNGLNREIDPATALCSRTLSSVELLPDGQRLRLKFDDKGPSIVFGTAAERAPFTVALATAEQEPQRAMDDPPSLIDLMMKRGFKKIASASFHTARRALRINLSAEDGSLQRVVLFCAQSLDGASVNSFAPVALSAD